MLKGQYYELSKPDILYLFFCCWDTAFSFISIKHLTRKRHYFSGKTPLQTDWQNDLS